MKTNNSLDFRVDVRCLALRVATCQLNCAISRLRARRGTARRLVLRRVRIRTRGDGKSDGHKQMRSLSSQPISHSMPCATNDASLLM